MHLQASITLNKNRRRVGKTYPVIVDSEGEGHTPFQTPEIDGKTFFTSNYPPGTIFEAKIKKVKDSFDLLAKG